MQENDPIVEGTDVRDQHKDSKPVEVSTNVEGSLPQHHQPNTKPVVLFPAGRSNHQSSLSSSLSSSASSSSSFITAYAPGELQMVEEEIKDLLKGYRQLVGDIEDTPQIVKKVDESIATTTTATTAKTRTTTTTTMGPTNGSIKTQKPIRTTSAKAKKTATATATAKKKTSTTSKNGIPLSPSLHPYSSSPPPTRPTDITDGVSTAAAAAAIVDIVVDINMNREKSNEVMPSPAVGCDRVVQSITSLPVSSVRGDHSTEANTPTPSFQMPKQMSPEGENTTGENGTTADAGGDSHEQQPFERISSSVDLFADALTEDHLNRSFEMQLQRRQQELELMRQQQLLRHGIPVIHMASTSCNNGNGRLQWNAVPSSSCLDEGLNHPAVWRATGTPVPPFVRQNKMSPNGSKNSIEVNDNGGGNYNSAAADAVAVAASSHRYQEVSFLQDDRSPLDLSSSRGMMRTMMNGQQESYPLRPENPNEQVDVGNVRMNKYAHLSFPSNKQSQKGMMKTNQHTLLLQGEEGEDEEEEDEEQLRLLQQQQQQQQLQQQYYLRNRSRHRGKAVDSTTPEIATSARRTENPSMRSGATGSRRKKTTTGTTAAAAAQMGTTTTTTNSATAARHMLNEFRYTMPGQVWRELDADDGLGLAPEEEYRLIEESDLVRGYKEQQQQQQQQTKRYGKKNYHHSSPQGNDVEYEYDGYPKPHHYRQRHNHHPQHESAATRFHNIIERRVAALERRKDNTGTAAAAAAGGTININNNNTRAPTITTQLPSFADSLVGAAISDLFPVVKRRQAQLKESQLAEAAAAAAADANRTRGRTHVRSRTALNKGSVGTVTSTPSTTPTPSTNVRSSRGSWVPAAETTRRRQQQQHQRQHEC
ncbi:uncharacterized protein TM35_000251990 [Trypanosoma theileri]|uniref:Uncharacterized protein n=1 Tax=Trypanosoma theileri TaxID=67003 RepID=A0A1X0NQZ1_9TRYP|nr:uncharacterized protein TM35_000251990 [Trypanosoma theileri]ORC86903.1 hypothetical protein TM35_000251990 [Trypanosoma theileri]